MAKFSKREYKRIAKRDHGRRKPKDPRPPVEMPEIEFEVESVCEEGCSCCNEFSEAEITNPIPADNAENRMPAFEKPMGFEDWTK